MSISTLIFQKQMKVLASQEKETKNKIVKYIKYEIKYQNDVHRREYIAKKIGDMTIRLDIIYDDKTQLSRSYKNKIPY